MQIELVIPSFLWHCQEVNSTATISRPTRRNKGENKSLNNQCFPKNEKKVNH